MVDIRACEQCGTEFTPRREHARFCSAGCRMAWNRGDARQATVSLAALDWSVNAMTEVTDRLAEHAGKTRNPVVIAVSDATWWVTLVDATLVRYHPGGYDATLSSLPAGEREEIEQTLAGLRFVRNQMGVHLDPAEFLADLTWNFLPEPNTRELTPRGQDWERSRYRAYQERLAGRPVTRAFTLAARFLRLAAASSRQGDHADGDSPPCDSTSCDPAACDPAQVTSQPGVYRPGPVRPESSMSA
jgi:hypothetical protein